MTEQQGAKDLAAQDAIVRNGLREWRAVGLALDKIERNELWKFGTQPNGQQFKSFGQFCRIEYEIHRQDAYRKIAQAVVAQAVDPGGSQFKQANAVRHFARSKQIGGTQTVERLRQEIDRMTPAQLVETRNQFQAALLDPDRESAEDRLREIETARSQIGKLRRFAHYEDQGRASELLEELEGLLP